MIFFILLFFYVNCALLEDEFDSDIFEDIYTVIPVLSEVKYPKISSDEVKFQYKANYWDKFQTGPIKRHIKLNETKEAYQSETIKMVFDLLNKLNLSIDSDLVPNLIVLGNKFNINVSKSEAIPRRSATITNNKITTLKSKSTEDADYKLVRNNGSDFSNAQEITCMATTKHGATEVTLIIDVEEGMESKESFNQTNETVATSENISETVTTIIATKEKLVAVRGFWFDGECRCNYILRSGCYKINPNLYFILFFDILSCIFGK